MARPDGGWISKYTAPTNMSAGGVWSLRDTLPPLVSQTWPDRDALRSSVVCMLHCDGTDGSTTFTDTSPSPKTITASGNAKISTTQAKFGGSSASFDGSGDWLSVPSVSLSSNFTVEMFVRWNARKNYGILVVGTNANTQLFLGLKSDATGLRWGLTGVVEYGSAAFTWSNNTWYHVALCRTSGVTKVFIDGAELASTVSGSSTSFSGTMEVAGGAGQSFEPNAYIDEFRVTTASRYFAAFTPPAYAFPDR